LSLTKSIYYGIIGVDFGDGDRDGCFLTGLKV